MKFGLTWIQPLTTSSILYSGVFKSIKLCFLEVKKTKPLVCLFISNQVYIQEYLNPSGFEVQKKKSL